MFDFSSYHTFWRRLQTELAYYSKGLYEELVRKDIFLWAQAIAFKVLINIVPILILATGVIGQVLGIERSFDAVASLVREFLPPEQSEGIVDFLGQLQGASGTITAIGVLGLFLSGVSLFITLRITVGNAFHRDWHETRSLLRGYLFDAVLFALIGVLFLISIGISVFLQSIEPRLGYSWILEGWETTIRMIGWLIPFVVTTAMFFLLFYFVPKPRPHQQSAFVGAVVTAVLWEGAKYAFTLYATYFGMLDTDGLTALSAAFGLVIVFVLWVYVSAILLMMGAVVASLHENRRRTGRAHTDPTLPPPPSNDTAEEPTSTDAAPTEAQQPDSSVEPD